MAFCLGTVIHFCCDKYRKVKSDGGESDDIYERSRGCII